MGFFISRARPSFLLQYPLEIRLQICEIVLTQPILFKHPYSGHPHEGMSLALLQVNRQIYNETRLLPFRVNKLSFQRWFGSSIFCCNTFLKLLLDWQIENIRRMELTVTERDLHGWQWNEGWQRICEIMGNEGGKQRALRSLTLRFHEAEGCNVETLFDGEQAWAKDLKKCAALQELTILVRSKQIEMHTLHDFEENLQRVLTSVRISVQRALGDGGE